MKKFLCNVLGHHIRRHVRAWYVKSEYSGYVADELVEERLSCLCKQKDSGWEKIDQSGINSLSMSSERWALLRRDGKVAAYTV